MALYLISYDIADKDAFEYQALWDLLDEMGAVKILYSEYVITGDAGKAGAIYAQVAPKTVAADRLLVQEVTKDAQWDRLLISDAEFSKLLASARG
ncbi:MAG: hypothetical protein JWN45_3034 [Acidobacteriaceae bacterium]|nr:hypothetical protein [Acidobacteriaceae bacterium]